MSLVSTDLPVWSVVETAATLYEKENERYHLLLNEPATCPEVTDLDPSETESSPLSEVPRLLWLELSPYRVIMTMQSHSRFSYRHFWEQGVYGTSRYWLQDNHLGKVGHIHLQNFTRSLVFQSVPLPTYLRVEYELWSNKVALGRYILNLDIQHHSH